MSTRQRPLTTAAIVEAVAGLFPLGPIFTVQELARALKHGVKTDRGWVALGRFDGAYRKRGKHPRFWLARFDPLH